MEPPVLALRPQAGGGHAQLAAASAWARARARACTCCSRPRRSRRCAAAASSPRTTCASSRARCSSTACCSRPDAELDGATPGGRAARGGAARSRSPGDSHRAPLGAALRCSRCPTMAAGFFPGWAALVLPAGRAALLAAGRGGLRCWPAGAAAGGCAALLPREAVGGRAPTRWSCTVIHRSRAGRPGARARTTCPRTSPPSPAGRSLTCRAESQTRVGRLPGDAGASAASSSFGDLHRARARARSGSSGTSARYPAAQSVVGLPGPARRQPPAALRRGAGPGEPGPAPAPPGRPRLASSPACATTPRATRCARWTGRPPRAAAGP